MLQHTQHWQALGARGGGLVSVEGDITARGAQYPSLAGHAIVALPVHTVLATVGKGGC